MWIRITDGEGRYYLCVDLDPPAAGRRGQLIGIDRHRDRMVHATSWAAYLEELAGELEAGAYRWDDDDGLVSQRVIR